MIKIRINAEELSANFPTGQFHVYFDGPQATVREALVEFDGSALKAVGFDNGRRLVPTDPLWWVDYQGEEIEVTQRMAARR